MPFGIVPFSSLQPQFQRLTCFSNASELTAYSNFHFLNSRLLLLFSNSCLPGGYEHDCILLISFP